MAFKRWRDITASMDNGNTDMQEGRELYKYHLDSTVKLDPKFVLSLYVFVNKPSLVTGQKTVGRTATFRYTELQS